MIARPPDPPLERAAVGGLTLAYQDVGQGPPLVLLHGFPFDHRQWSAQVAGLAESARLIVPDLRGHGASDAPPPPYAMVEMAEDVRALVDHLGCDRFVLGGLSMGGYIAMAFAGRYPERLRGLVLMATRVEADDDDARGRRMELAARAGRGGASEVADDLVAGILGQRAVDPGISSLVREMILGTSVEGLVGCLQGMAARPASTAALAEFNSPALIVVGRDDQLTPPARARAMAALLTEVEMLEVPGAGHLVALEQPEPVNHALQTFLTGLAAHDPPVPTRR